MESHALVAVVSLLAVLVPFWMGLRVALARRACGIAAPAMTGDPVLERSIRAHYNTLEWLPIFLTGLWLFAIYGNDRIAAALGVVWIFGRVIYQLGYVAEPRKRFPGFLLQALATAILVVGALVMAVQALLVTGA